MRKLLSSLAFRLICLYGAVFTLLAFLLLGAQYWMTVHAPYLKARNRVQAEASALAAIHDTGGLAALQLALEARRSAGATRRPFHVLVAPDGRVLTGNLADWPRQRSGDWLRLSAVAQEDGEAHDIEPLLRDQVLADGARLLAGRDIEDIDELEEKLLSVALGVVVTGAVLGLLGGWLMSRTMARRIGAVTRIATQVMEGDLSSRIPLTGQNDDFDSLNGVLNQMLARIEHLVESVRRVSDSVAHELRTPLARLRASLESMRGAQADIPPARIEELLAEVASLEKTFDAVLRIARIESARQTLDCAPVNLSAVIADAAELYAPAAEDRAQRLDIALPPDLTVSGDRDLLFQSFCNLLDNAIKYTPQGGRITLQGHRDEHGVGIAIRDSGPGIPAAHVAHVTERFYRVPATAAEPGIGLGLTLVAAVASRHHSTLLFEDGAPGLIVRWLFPAARP